MEQPFPPSEPRLFACLRCFVPASHFNPLTVTHILWFYVIECATLIVRCFVPPCDQEASIQWWVFIILQLVCNVYFFCVILRSCPWLPENRRAAVVTFLALIGLFVCDLVLAGTKDLKYLLQFGVDFFGYIALVRFWQTKHDNDRPLATHNGVLDGISLNRLFVLHLLFTCLNIVCSLVKVLHCDIPLTNTQLIQAQLIQAQLEFFLLGYIFHGTSRL